MLTLNKNMKQAIQTFNKISPDKASVILSRIFSSPTAETITLFSEKEKHKLLKLIKISEVELQNMLRAFSFLLMYAVAEKNFPEIQVFLRESGMSMEHLEVVSQTWVTYSSEYAIKVRERQAAIDKELKSFNWSLYLPVDDSRLPIREYHEFEKTNKTSNNLYNKDERNPGVEINFELTDKETFSVKLRKEDVQNLFETFEKIQDKLDNLL